MQNLFLWLQSKHFKKKSPSNTAFYKQAPEQNLICMSEYICTVSEAKNEEQRQQYSYHSKPLTDGTLKQVWKKKLNNKIQYEAI